jgi:O-methyltransferase involved in polyketide biosynthesis
MKIDTTVQHIGRIYDYVLGGHHNYEVDRKAAEEMKKLVPAYPRWARLNRWFLQLVASKWAEAGQTRVLDLASGLPTQGHFNEYLPKARILFCDIDPVSVLYGQQILAPTPNAVYVQTDLRAPEGILAEATAFFAAERKLAVGAIGILYFLTDEEIRSLMQKLHAFCAPGSVMAMSFVHVPEGPEAAFIHDLMKKTPTLVRINVHARTPDQMAELIKPWRLTVHRKAEEWLDVPEMLTGTDLALSIMGALAEH